MQKNYLNLKQVSTKKIISFQIYMKEVIKFSSKYLINNKSLKRKFFMQLIFYEKYLVMKI